MKVKLPTGKLQEMLSKAIKGASFNKNEPMSSMIVIEVKDNKLTLTTTDGTNYLYIMQDVKAKDFYTVVNADIFTKLVSKMTCDEITLELTKDYLLVSGNGDYKIELELDADGTPAKLPNPIEDIELNSTETVSLSVINTILNTAKASLMSGDMRVPCYTGYYMGERVVTTDATQICGIDFKLFDEPKLLSPAMLDLVGLMSDELITVQSEDGTIVFATDDCIVYGKEMSYIDEFNIDALTEHLDCKFATQCKFSKHDFLAILDRLSLFVGKYDKNQISMIFTESGVDIASKTANAVETLNYRSVKDFEPYECIINIDMLINQIKAYDGDEIEFWYKDETDSGVKLVNGATTQMIALCE